MNMVIRKAVRGEGKAIAALVKEVYDRMPEEQKIWFSTLAIEEDTAHIDAGDGSVLGYLAVDEENGGRIGGVFTVVFPGLSEKNLGHYAGFSEAELLLVAHMDTAAVLPDYRGLHLQRRLMETAEAELAEMGYRYLMCTVHPDNPYSHGNLDRMGYRRIWQGLKYGGKLRDVVLKEI